MPRRKKNARTKDDERQEPAAVKRLVMTFTVCRLPGCLLCGGPAAAVKAALTLPPPSTAGRRGPVTVNGERPRPASQGRSVSPSPGRRGARLAANATY